ncbi:Phosphorylated carbohydrates phosphatase [Golovinomyces cichoracearum]|uniref:Phosphorylated carbohydrates phosphatase n=1 Tax=Golovinomyces cichoracearum TaxID=62708 RepID=A0A420J821_9PEZI|nr:Phosphorylated carbohydrates phosphatase [Golovinomyces cichoracearum]
MAKKITTLLFDCDNTLVLSEKLAFGACAALVSRILASKGIEVNYSGEQLLAEFVGQNFRGMICKLAEKYALEISAEELESYVKDEEEEVIKKLKEAVEPCKGVTEVLDRLHKIGTYKLAVVSSSAKRRVLVTLNTVGFDRFFDLNTAVFSAATSLPKPTSKPDPAIYLWAMEKLGVSPSECLAIEDSKSGALSAHRAGISTIGYTGSYVPDEVKKIIPVLKDSGVAVIMNGWDEFENLLEQVEIGKIVNEIPS